MEKPTPGKAWAHGVRENLSLLKELAAKNGFGLRRVAEAIDEMHRQDVRLRVSQSGRPLGEAVRTWLRWQGVSKVGELPFRKLPEELKKIVEFALFERERRDSIFLGSASAVGASAILSFADATGFFLQVGSAGGALGAAGSPTAHSEYQSHVRQLAGRLQEHREELERHGIVLDDYTHVAVGGYGDVYLLRQDPRTRLQGAMQSQPLRTYAARIQQKPKA